MGVDLNTPERIKDELELAA